MIRGMVPCKVTSIVMRSSLLSTFFVCLKQKKRIFTDSPCLLAKDLLILCIKKRQTKFSFSDPARSHRMNWLREKPILPIQNFVGVEQAGIWTRNMYGLSQKNSLWKIFLLLSYSDLNRFQYCDPFCLKNVFQIFQKKTNRILKLFPFRNESRKTNFLVIWFFWGTHPLISNSKKDLAFLQKFGGIGLAISHVPSAPCGDKFVVYW